VLEFALSHGPDLNYEARTRASAWPVWLLFVVFSEGSFNLEHGFPSLPVHERGS